MTKELYELGITKIQINLDGEGVKDITYYFEGDDKPWSLNEFRNSSPSYHAMLRFENSVESLTLVELKHNG